MSQTRHNHLTGETSPYLQQHADNPVEWYPWGEEALAKAQRENKPILLSIGYSACHWCHVMAHESFEDPATAAIMNREYVNIKVDREERPDLDKIYQTAHYLLTRKNGGWPLTMFLTPHDQLPFYGGTYFPNTARHNLPAFDDLLERIARYFAEQQDSEISTQNLRMTEALGRIYAGRPAAEPLPEQALITRAIDELREQYDSEQGGFGSSPKFPHPTGLELLLRNPAAPLAEEMATFTLHKMAWGGMHDQLAGGFCRYSVDNFWLIPHFEKMLYDNAALLSVYALAYRLSGETHFAETARATANWVIDSMQAEQGGYFSSLDADSDGEEGKFYVWERAEIEAALSPADFAIFEQRYGLSLPVNFEGKWNLHVHTPIEVIAAQTGQDESGIKISLHHSIQQLLPLRAKRVAPARDEKILTAWNALMIKGMAQAALALPNARYADSAIRALDFIQRELWRDGRLLATCKEGKAHLMAYLDDHAYLLDAILEVLQVRWNSDHLQFAIELAELLLQHFADQDNGGFWFTADDHEQLIQRPKTWGDDAIPAGNGVAAKALLRLGALLGETRYLHAAQATLVAAQSSVMQAPSGHCALLLAMQESVQPGATLIVRAVDDGQLDAWAKALKALQTPSSQTYLIPAGASGLPESLQAKRALGTTTLYHCSGMSCSAPITDVADLADLANLT